jgi:ABC-2 type transport system permease protein
MSADAGGWATGHRRASAARTRGGGLGGAFRAEWRKLLAQLSTRVLVLVCALGPFAFAVVLDLQSGVPADTLLGVWVHSSGYAVAFVVLGFGGFWGFPVLAGVLAGDLFSCEDRYGTWKLVLTRSASREQVFAAKVLAAAALTTALVGLLAVTSVLAGLLVVGGQPLVGFAGTEIASGHCLALALLSWLSNLLPVLAFTSLALLFSIATRNGITGVLGPVLVGLVMQLLALIGSGTWVHLLLVASAFDDWHGLLSAPGFYGPLVVGSLVSLAWIVACLWASWAILRGRDFAGTPVARRRGWVAPLRVVLGAAAVIGVLGIATNWGPAAITKGRIQASLAPTFNELALLQQRQLGRPVSAGARLDDRTLCARRGGAGQGPGDDWGCTISVVGRGAGEVETVTYDVSVKSNGCYKADAPPSFVGQQMMTDVHGNSVVNPLFTIYGCFDTTAVAPSCRASGECHEGHNAGSGAGASTPAANGARSSITTSAADQARHRAEAQALRRAERAAGPRVVREIEQAERKEAREPENPTEQGLARPTGR